MREDVPADNFVSGVDPCKIRGDMRVRRYVFSRRAGGKREGKGTKADRIEIDTGEESRLTADAAGTLKSLNTITRYCIPRRKVGL